MSQQCAAFKYKPPLSVVKGSVSTQTARGEFRCHPDSRDTRFLWPSCTALRVRWLIADCPLVLASELGGEVQEKQTWRGCRGAGGMRGQAPHVPGMVEGGAEIPEPVEAAGLL